MVSQKTRLIIVGSIMVVGAIAFALTMMAIAPQSTNPAELMRTVGQVAGTVIGVGAAVIVTALVKFRGKAADAGARAGARQPLAR